MKDHHTSLDMDSLGIDWARQRAQINQKIELKKVQGRKIRPVLAVGSAVAVAVLMLVVWWHQVSSTTHTVGMDEFMVEIDTIAEDYVPAGLYVLNGFLDTKPDAEVMVEFVLPQDWGEEDL